MPKLNWSDDMPHTSDADFRAWVGRVEGALAESGLVRSADTGQINPATVIRPGTNAMAGYSVWRFNDLLQAAAPVFVRIEYGTGTQAAVPAMTVQMGESSNGSGVLGGRTTSVYVIRPASTSAPTGSRCFAVHNAWGAALVLRVTSGSSSGNTAGFGWAIQRTVDAVGQPTSDGVMLHVSAASPATSGAVVFFQNVPIPLTHVTVGDDIAHCPLSLNNYVVGVSPQIFPTWCALPKVRPMAFLGVAPGHSAPGAGQTFQMAIVGTIPRTYISVSGGLSRHYAWQGVSTPGASFLMWED